MKAEISIPSMSKTYDFSDGKVFFVELVMSESDYISEGLDPIKYGMFGHFWVFSDIGDKEYIIFTLTSKFYKAIFREEFGVFTNFLENECPSCTSFATIISQYKSIKDIIEKYKSSDRVSNRELLFLLNKDFYGLTQESMIDIGGVSSINKDIFHSMIDKGRITLEKKPDFRDRDKGLLSKTIHYCLSDSDTTKGIQPKMSILTDIMTKREDAGLH